MPSNPLVYDFDPRWFQPTPHPMLGWLALTVVVLLGFAVSFPLRRCKRWHVLARAALALFAAAALLVQVELGLQTLAENYPALVHSQPPSLFWRMQPGPSALNPQAGPAGPAPENKLPRLPPNLLDTTASLAPGVTVVSSNSQGLREREIPLQKSAGEYRIVCIGDSWTFGLGVRAEETWERRLEVRLQARYPSRRITVINAGMPGAAWLQGYLMLTQVVLQYDPDLVLIGGFAAREPLPEVDDLDRPSLGFLGFVRQSLTYALLRNAVSYFDSSSAGDRGLSRLDYARRCADVLERRGIRSVFYSISPNPPGNFRGPFPEIMSPDEPLDGLTSSPRRRVVGFHPLMWQRSPDQFMLPHDRSHPNPRGHEELARLTAECLQQWGILDDQ